MQSVRARLAFRFAAIAGAILAIFGASLYLWIRDSLESELDTQLQGRVKMVRQMFLEEYQESLQGIHADPGAPMLGFLRSTDTRGSIVRSDGTPLCSYEASGEGWRAATERVTTPDGATFTITVSVSDAQVRGHLTNVRIFFAVFFPLVLLASFLVGYVFVGRALAPVEEIRRQAEQISRANLDERVPEPASTGEFRELARTFNEMLERLQKAFDDLQNFAADAAHELRTPLANLRAEIDVTLQQARTPEEYEHALTSLDEEVSRMSQIVTDLFTLAKIDMRQYALRKERVQLRPLLEEARETWQRAAEGRHIRISLEGRDASAAGDPVALRRVFMNLVENAVKYNRDGGEVHLGLETANGHVRVRVRDTGIGIRPEHLPKLFRRFYRIDKARSRESGGAGLGLAICKSFIDAHEGTIEVDSRPGEGTTFTVDLPSAV